MRAALVHAEREPEPRRPFKLPRSFNLAIFGALVGGVLAGLLIVARLFSVDGLWAKPMAPLGLVAGGGLSAAVVSAAIQLGIARARQMRWRGDPTVVGGTAGGALSGIVGGAFLGWYVGAQSARPLQPGLVVAGAVTAVMAMAMAVVLHRRRAYGRQALRALGVAALVVALTALPLVAVLGRLDTAWLAAGKAGSLAGDLRHSAGGGVIGAVVGAMMGFQVGMTLWIIRRWDELARVEPRVRARRRSTSRMMRYVPSVFIWTIALFSLGGAATRVVQAESIAAGADRWTLAFLVLAATLGTAGRIRFSIEHKGLKVELGTEGPAGAPIAVAAEHESTP
jgi:MFS family permease